MPLHVEYSLTPMGHELVALLVPLLGWVAEHADDILAQTLPTREVTS